MTMSCCEDLVADYGDQTTSGSESDEFLEIKRVKGILTGEITNSENSLLANKREPAYLSSGRGRDAQTFSTENASSTHLQHHTHETVRACMRP